MKTTLLRKVERFRLLAMLLVTVCAHATANAQGATSDEINAAIVTKSDVAITWTNDAQNPWSLINDSEDGVCLQSNEMDSDTWKSSVSFSVTLSSPSGIAFQYRNDGQSFEDHINIKVDDAEIVSGYNGEEWRTFYTALTEGSHTVTIERYDVNGKDDESYFARIRNIVMAEMNWDEIKLDVPGELIEKLVNILGDRNVQDIQLLRISGPMNSTDWEGLRRLKGLVGLDMIGVDVSVIPERAFFELRNLMTVRLPETIVEIGYQAFMRTSCSGILIPASVEKIQTEAWCDTPLTYIIFADNSRLKRIGHAAFHGTRIKEFIMPDSVDELEAETFSSCIRLKKLHISESLKRIPYNMSADTDLNSVDIPEGVTYIEWDAFRYNKNLTSVVIPRNVTVIENTVFADCQNLKEVTIKASAVEMREDVFYGCPIETIIVPTATPPVTYYDPFSSIDKTSTTVLVPDFALATFKTDPYWFQYTHIQSTDEVSEGDYWAINGRLKLNSSTTFAGTPSVEIGNGAVFEIAANTNVAFNDFTYNTQEDIPSCFLNESANVTANSLTTKFYVPESGRWYFFSPVTDVKMADVKYPATDSWVIYRYDGNRRATENSSEGNWAKMTISDVLKRGQGYIIQAGTPGDLHLPAAASEHSTFFGLGEAPMTIADNTAESAENTGWNLVGNPYPAYYDIYSIALQAPITVWDGSTYRAYSLTDDNYILRPMQPFFVQKSSSDITLAMPRGGRQGSNEVIRPHAQQVNAVDANRHKLNLEITRGDRDRADDYTRIVINEEASLGYEGTCDASKFMSMDGGVAQIYSVGMNSHPLAINERPYADGNAALGVYIPEAGAEYRISASRADRKAWLYDTEANIEQDLTEGDYIFTATGTGTIDNRFSIRFAPLSSNAVEGIAEADVKVTGNEGSISVAAPQGATVSVYGIDGTLAATATAKEGTIEFAVAGGAYIVKVNGQSFKTIVK